jgi:hypothetical protein
MGKNIAQACQIFRLAVNQDASCASTYREKSGSSCQLVSSLPRVFEVWSRNILSIFLQLTDKRDMQKSCLSFSRSV